MSSLAVRLTAIGPSHPPWTVRRARQVMLAVHVPVIALAPACAVFGTPGNPGGQAPVLAVVLGLAMGAIQLRHSLAAARGGRPRLGLLTLGTLAVLAYLPLWWFGWNWTGSQILLMASAPMVLRGWLVPVVAVAPGLVTAAVAVVGDIQAGDPSLAFGVPFWILYWGVAVPVVGLALYAAVRLVRVVGALQAARTELAELAILRERLRISRDLHDSLGQSLSAVSLKGDLAVRLLRRDPRAARAEIEDLVGVARDALHDVRAVSQNERAVSLRAEVDGAAALLAAAGVNARITVDLRDLAAPVEAVLAWAVREGVTNLLRHSDARTCSITGARTKGTVRLEIVNDGAGPFSRDGTGVAGLAERAGALSGLVSARATGDGGFRLLVEIPGASA